MYVRLNNKQIDLRTVANITRTDDKTFSIQYQNGRSETVSTENTEPQNSIELMNALVRIFEDIKNYEAIENKS